MNPRQFKKFSHPERIVYYFTHLATEAHKDSVAHTVGITPEQFEDAIARARDIGIEDGLRLTPIYEREGWWTGRPTERLAAIALHESVNRNAGEAERNARVYESFHEVGGAARIVEQTYMGNLATIRAKVDAIDVSAGADYVLTSIDEAEKQGRRFVEAEGRHLKAVA